MSIKKVNASEVKKISPERLEQLAAKQEQDDVDFSDIPPLDDPELWKKQKTETTLVRFELAKDLSDWLEGNSQRMELVNSLVDSICRELKERL